MIVAAGSSAARADPEVEALAITTGAVILGAMLADGARHDEPDYLALEVGGFDPIKNANRATAFGGEYRFRQLLWWELRPFVGGGFTSDRSIYGYGGIRIAAYWGEQVVITPSFAIGGYSRGDGKDLGSPAVLGRFGLDLEYRFDNGVRFGAAYHHYSNGKLLGQTTNPGTEVVGVTLSLPMR